MASTATTSFIQQCTSFLREQEFLILILCAIGLARLYPYAGVHYMYPDITATWIAVILIFILAGLGLPTAEFTSAFQNIRFNMTIQCYSFFFVSAFVYGVCQLLVHYRILNNPSLADGMIICSCLPMAINTVIVVTKSSNGDEASAVFNAAVANLVGVFVSPFLILFYLGVHGTMDPIDIFIKLALRVLLPVVIGQILQRMSWVQTYIIRQYKGFFKQLQQYSLVFIVYTVFCRTFLPTNTNDPTASTNVLSTADVITMILCQFVLLLSVMIMAWYMLQVSFPDQPKLRVMGFVGCTFKTVAVGVPLVNAMYAQTNPDIVGLYTYRY
jgi:solute carrier family 10 (sodium/bile acid cotransporter), member 7